MRSLARKQVQGFMPGWEVSRAAAGCTTPIHPQLIALKVRQFSQRFRILRQVMLYRTYMGLGSISRIALADIAEEFLNPYWGPALRGRKTLLASIKMLVADGKLVSVGNCVALPKKNGVRAGQALSLCRVESKAKLRIAA